jgi:putative Mg2+ transporter-C (MgtC) family protein
MTADTFINISLAILFGGLIGFERQWNQGMAGLRTNTLVAFGSACFVTVGVHAGGDRVAAQIVSGMGFLGAGVILHEGPTVRGLNTAATLWCAGAVGCLSASGMRWEAGYAAAGVVVLNLGMRYVQATINRHAPHPGDVETTYAVEIACGEAEAEELRLRFLDDVAEAGLQLGALYQEQLTAPAEGVRISADLISHSRQDRLFDALIAKLRRHPAVTSLHWSLSVRGGTATAASVLSGRRLS